MPATEDDHIPKVRVDAKTGEISCADCSGRLFLSHSKQLLHVDNESRFHVGSVEEKREWSGA